MDKNPDMQAIYNWLNLPETFQKLTKKIKYYFELVLHELA